MPRGNSNALDVGLELGRDVVAVLNLERKYLTFKGLVPLAPMPSEHTLEVAALPVKGWVRRMSLNAANKYKQMRMSI
jgi:transposase